MGQGCSNAEIAKALHRSYGAIAAAITRLRPSLPRRTYEQQARIRGWVDRSRDDTLYTEPILAQERRALREEFRGRGLDILVLSDLHGSFRHHGVLNAAGQVRADVCVLAGDILDAYAVSRFRRHLRIDLKRELFDATEILQWLSERFPRVIALQGNHDQRAYRQMLDALQKYPDLAELLKEETDLLHKVAEGLPNVTAMKGWWVRLGDAIFCHRERWMKHERSLGEDVVRYFENLGPETAGFSLAVTGHVHRMCWLPIKRGVLYIENGMCCNRPDYTRESGALSAITAAGYTTVSIRNDGTVDFNKARPHLIAWE